MSGGKSEIRDGMRIDWDAPIEMDDGVVLRADVYRPIGEGKHPVILTYGPYAKYLHFSDGYPYQWGVMVERYPEVAAGSSSKYQVWEVADPEKWVPDGYACVRVDSRGAGRSPGLLDPWSPRETQDVYQCIEWAGTRPWSSGKVGMNGISYYAMNQFQAACLDPPHLAAMCLWEGAVDLYREMAFHGGIFCRFVPPWYENTVVTRQHGLGARGHRCRMNGDWVSGPETLTEEELGANRRDYGEDIFSHPLDDDYWKARMPDWSKVKTPFLSSGNWGAQGLFPRGNVEGFMLAASEEKWLEMHGREHWVEFYTDYGVALQKKFFGHFLKGEDTGWKDQPRVQLLVRHPGEKFVERAEDEWPIARTEWTKLYLDPAGHTLTAAPPATAGSVTYAGLGDGVTFLTPPLEEEMEITGPSAAKLFVSSETEDADLFLVLRVFTADMKEVTFQGALDPHKPVAQGWLRASHRKLDPERSLPYRPFHAHDEKQPLAPGEVVELDIEIWPPCIVVPPGHRIGLSVRGRDYVYPGAGGGDLPSVMLSGFTGVGPFLHDDPRDRPPAIFGGEVTLHTGPGREAYVLLPVIPPK
ncbi:MAG: CocE/NonD family hydrolase [bacterium]